MSPCRLKSRIGLVLAAIASVLSISAVSQGSFQGARDILHRPAVSDGELPPVPMLSPIVTTIAEPLEIAVLPHAHVPYGPRPPYWQPGCPTLPVPTLRSMQNHFWQEHQWRADYPVCQPLYVPTYGHFGTRWRTFPGTDCYGVGPAPSGQPF